MIRKFFRRQILNRFIYRMREELYRRYSKQESYTLNQIEKCADSLGYPKEYYRYGYLLFMNKKNVMKAFQIRKIEDSLEPAGAYLAVNLSPALKWTPLGACLMAEYSQNISSMDDATENLNSSYDGGDE